MGKGLHISGYTGVQAGAFTTKQQTSPEAVAVFGGKLEKNNTYAEGEVKLGSATGVKISAGHEFDLSKHTGVELSAQGGVIVNNYKSNFKETFNLGNGTQEHISMSIPEFDTPIEIDIPTTLQSEVVSNYKERNGYAKVGAAAMVDFKGKQGGVKIGLEGGYRSELAPKTKTLQITATGTTNTYVNIDGVSLPLPTCSNYKIEGVSTTTPVQHKQGAYLTPKLEAEWKPKGENGKFAFTADADLSQATVGFKYNF